ncbi:MAG TPA: permease [Cryomorphaceae bacterium]|nr:permease [Owenweeksia sp.]MBF99780.1 permease [Owenweeksia sp.]HAD96785.1 permease [Cryomorphaceae bacterium]HBF20832.1 permease [Cryomorphaceae bacterium]|tara:strand:- start:9653 stop:10870 length:1218 start_codon:yes stop_codon:yes gene_type:complete
MQSFLEKWGEAAYTTIGLFWMALWAFAFGYVISSMIQVFVTQQRMQKLMGKDNLKSISLGTFFGFISSSCSFAALATTKSLLKKGAGFISSIAFLLASTNLVVELGIIIALFLSWQFVVGEYIGGLLLIAISWIFIRLTKPEKLIKKARERLGSSKEEDHQKTDWKKQIKSRKGWAKVGMQYHMEWDMVWKDVSVGFTVAGIISAFVPSSFFETLFIGTGNGSQTDLSFIQILEHTLVGPVAAFFTFIGSMGNIPLAALLFQNGVSFAGVMAFIFSDLVVFPVLRINARYYGWKMSTYILLMLFTALVGTTLLMHYGLLGLNMLPEQTGGGIQEMTFFKIDYGFVLNIVFLALSAYLIYLSRTTKMQGHGGHEMPDKGWLEIILRYAAWISYGWLAIGLVLKAVL